MPVETLAYCCTNNASASRSRVRPRSSFRKCHVLFHYLLGSVHALLEFHRNVWHKKLISGLSYGVVYVILGLAIFVELRLVIDGHKMTASVKSVNTQYRFITFSS